MIASRLPILGLLVASVVAQGTSNRFIPADAQVIVRIAAPAQWRNQFEDTKIARVLGGETLAPLLAQVEEGFKGGEEAEELGIDPEMLEGLWNNYTGDIVIAIQLDLEDVPSAIEEGRTPTMAMVISLSSDESYDLPALTNQLSEAIENKSGVGFEDVTVDDHTLRCRVEDDGSVSLPTMIDDHFVMLWSNDMEQLGATMLAADNRRESAGAGKALYVHLDAEQGINTLMELVAWQMDNDINALPIDFTQLLTDLGLSCLRTLEVSVDSDGDQLIVETDLRTSAEDRGFLGAFLLDHGAPKTLRYLPASASSFTCQAFDFGAIYNTIGNVWGGLDEIAPMSFDDIEGMFEDATKVRLREDIVDHIGTEVLYLVDYDAAEDMDPDDIGALFAGTCYALTLGDGKAFGESLEKAIRSRGLHAARKSEDYQGIKVYRMRLAGAFEIEYAITDDLLILTPGSDDASRAQLRSILDARRNPQAGVPEKIAKYAGTVPAGWNGVGITPMASVLSQIDDLMAQAPPSEMPPELEMILGLMGRVGAEMKQVGLNDAVQFSYASPTGIRTIMRL